MEPIKEEARDSQLEPFPDHDAGLDFHIVDESSPAPLPEKTRPKKKLRFQRIRGSVGSDLSNDDHSVISEPEKDFPRPRRWRMGMLEERAIGGVPGSICLFDQETRNIASAGVSPSAFSARMPTFNGYPRSGVTTPKTPRTPRTPRSPTKKRSKDGKILLEPQPDDSNNDPLNWKQWKKELALLSLGVTAGLGGAMATPYPQGLEDKGNFELSFVQLDLVHAIFMVGMALGHIFLAPTATMYGKRLIYIICGWLFIITCIWAAFSPRYESLIVARLFMGIAVSPVEMLIPASIAEMFHLHQRGVRLGIYTFFLLGGINLVPVISAAITQSFKWQWLLWIWAILGCLALTLIFLLVPESYWDRTLRPIHTKTCIKSRSRANSGRSIRSYFSHCTCPPLEPGSPHPGKPVTFERLSPAAIEQRVAAHRERVLARINAENEAEDARAASSMGSPPHNGSMTSPKSNATLSPPKVGFLDQLIDEPRTPTRQLPAGFSEPTLKSEAAREGLDIHDFASPPASLSTSPPTKSAMRARGHSQTSSNSSATLVPSTSSTPPRPSSMHRTLSSHSNNLNRTASFSSKPPTIHAPPPDSPPHNPLHPEDDDADSWPPRPSLRLDLETIMFDRESVGAFTQDTGLSGYQNGLYSRSFGYPSSAGGFTTPGAGGAGVGFGGCAGAGWGYTERLRGRETESWKSGLKVWRGELVDEKWLVLAAKPFWLVGMAPSVCWASLVWGMSVGWMVVLPRAVRWCFVRDETYTVAGMDSSYGFSATTAGALSLATLFGVLLGCVVAGMVSDVLAKVMARRNMGVYEPEFRLLMILPAFFAAGIGFMGFGWTVEMHKAFAVPAVFLGFIGFGCGLGALTAANYVVDCVPGAVVEAMVVLGVVRCLCHSLVLDLVIDRWISARGPKEMFLVIGGVHLAVLLLTVPIYIFGKRARGWGARKTLFEQS